MNEDIYMFVRCLWFFSKVIVMTTLLLDHSKDIIPNVCML
jgi:hypothetical protein